MKSNTYGFIGLGLIGGSLALSFKSTQPECKIMAYTRTRATVEEAYSSGTIDEICESIADPRFSKCDIIFLCAPVSKNIDALKAIKDVISDDCILTDVGSVKTDIHNAAHDLGLDGRFIGGHPMTGSEKSGFTNADSHLFENTYYILTPSEGTSPEKIELLKDVTLSTGAISLTLNYMEHDFATAAVSHLPHLIAVSLVNTVHDLDSKEQIMKLIAAGGFKDITRIASSSPEMWEPICLSNKDNISKVMDTFIALLENARTAMLEHDGGAIYRAFERSRNYRNSFSSSTHGLIRKSFSIYCDIIDESGAVATVATILAIKGISIKNIGILNNREFDSGVLRIEFDDLDTTLKAAEILRSHRYQIWVR